MLCLNASQQSSHWIVEAAVQNLYLRVEDNVFRRAHLLLVRVMLDVDARGMMSVVAAQERRGNVRSGEIYVCRVVL